MKIKGLLLLVILATMVLAGAEDEHNTLPLGPSQYKFNLGNVEKDHIVETASMKTVTIEEMINHTPRTQVYVIGEFHDSYECHRFQRDFIEALFKKNPRIVVGFEFFKRSDNHVLEQWRTGKITEDKLLEKTGWYQKTGLNYGYTRLIMKMIQKYNIKTIGLNIERSILHKVSRKGFDTLSAEEKKWFPTIKVPNPEHRFLIKTIFGKFAVQIPLWFENIYNAQKCWDVIMAESMRKALEGKELRGYRGVIIAGNFHVAYKLGIPFRYRLADRRVVITTIVPVHLPEKSTEKEEEHPMLKMLAKNLQPTAVFSRGIGDYIFSVIQPEVSMFPDLGITIKLSEGKFEISRVKEKSIGSEYGMKKGDIIEEIDGIEIKSIQQLRLILARKNWDESILMGIKKRIEFKKKSKD